MAFSSDWDDEADAQKPKRGFGDEKGLEQLEDGEYAFQIERAFTIPWKQKGPNARILKVKLETLGRVTRPNKEDPDEVELVAEPDGSILPRCVWPTFVGDPEAFHRMRGEVFQALGFDVEEWTKANGRPFSEESAKALRHAKGIQFVGRKTTSGDDKRPFHNLRVVTRILSDGKPEKFGPDDLNKPIDEIGDDDAFNFGANAPQ